MAFRHTVITPPLQENTSVIDADLPPAWADAWTTKLVPALQEMGCSVLDPRFAACSTLCNSAYSEEARGDAAGEDARLVAKLRANSDLGQLATANLSPVGRHTVLEWLAQRASAGPPLSGIDREFLRSLPIYPTLDGGVAAIEGGSSPAHGAVNTAVYAAVAGSDGALPPALLRQLLSCKPELEGLYNALGVQLLSASELLVVILRWEGGFAGLSRSTQNACVGLMASKWEELQESHCCVEAMAAAAFVSTANGSLACPRDLYDPSLPLLASIFAGQAVFPHGRFATPAWLDILRTLGLRRALTRDTFLEAARQVSARVKEVCDKAGGGRALASPGQLLSPEGVQVWEAACALARHLADDEGSRLLLGGEGRQFASELREVRNNFCFLPS